MTGVGARRPPSGAVCWPENRLAGRRALSTLGPVWIGEIDVRDDDLLRRYWEAGKEADGFHRPCPAFWSLQAATVALRSTPEAAEQHPIAAIDDDLVVATSQVVFPLHDNTHLAYIEPLVRPAYRRRGIGTALLQAAVEKVRNSGRTTVIAEVNMPLEGTSDDYDFMAKRRFETGIRNIHRVLERNAGSEPLARHLARC